MGSRYYRCQGTCLSFIQAKFGSQHQVVLQASWGAVLEAWSTAGVALVVTDTVSLSSTMALGLHMNSSAGFPENCRKTPHHHCLTSLFSSLNSAKIFRNILIVIYVLVYRLNYWFISFKCDHPLFSSRVLDSLSVIVSCACGSMVGSDDPVLFKDRISGASRAWSPHGPPLIMEAMGAWEWL